MLPNSVVSTSQSPRNDHVTYLVLLVLELRLLVVELLLHLVAELLLLFVLELLLPSSSEPASKVELVLARICS